MNEKQPFTASTCLIIHPELPAEYMSGAGAFHRSPEAMRDEAASLAGAINLTVQAADIVKISRPSPSHLISEGARERIQEMINDHKPEVVMINHALSPVQQRNLETDWKVKVIDRTGLILEIFGKRAQSAEGKIQVQLAALQYQRSRLVKAWTHLERQRGGSNGIGGPGETQLEIDRRLIDDKITRLKRELEDVQARRDLERKGRDKVPFKTVAIVGYTNAGKSTLFNRVTGSEVFAKDLLFATLDTTMRRLKLPGGETVILSDTVGFISDLPTSLVAAFRATLDQLQYAHVILHVRDVTAPDFRAQRDDVHAVMKDLGINAAEDPRVIEVWNKVDALPTDAAFGLDPKAHGLGDGSSGQARGPQGIVKVSAYTGQGLDNLLAAIEAKISDAYERHTVRLKAADGASQAWFYAHAKVLDTRVEDDDIVIDVDIDPANWGKWTTERRA